MTTFVYGLVSSGDESENIKYIGQTCVSVSKRLNKHIENARCGIKTHCYNWIRSQLKIGNQINAVILEKNAIYGVSERKWIKWYRLLGAELTNLTDGGDGVIGWRPTDEQRRNMSIAHRGKTHVQTEARIKAQKENFEKLHSDPHRGEKISKALSGRTKTKEELEKRTKTRRSRGGYTFSDEWKMAQSIRIKQWWENRKGNKNVE
jgi:D-mannonate dehydratase